VASPVQLVISDAHRGLTNAIRTVLQGAAWQRCLVHFMRNALAKVNKGHDEIGRRDHPHDLRPTQRPEGP
jgi:transposase-like protein